MYSKSTPNSRICQIDFHHYVQNTQKLENRLHDNQKQTSIEQSTTETISAFQSTDLQTILWNQTELNQAEPCLNQTESCRTKLNQFEWKRKSRGTRTKIDPRNQTIES